MFIDIHRDKTAQEKVVPWTGHASVPTLVIAPDDGLDPIAPPTPLGPHGRARAFDRGSMLTEPDPIQIAGFLARNGIPVRERDQAPSTMWRDVRGWLLGD